jgi:hypothetical protein
VLPAEFPSVRPLAQLAPQQAFGQREAAAQHPGAGNSRSGRSQQNPSTMLRMVPLP